MSSSARPDWTNYMRWATFYLIASGPLLFLVRIICADALESPPLSLLGESITYGILVVPGMGCILLCIWGQSREDRLLAVVCILSVPGTMLYDWCRGNTFPNFAMAAMMAWAFVMVRASRVFLSPPAPAVPLCISCGYNLTGNESGVCPECGHDTH